ncbi:NADH dehydrogenase [Halobaculum gomorrense]|uniref:NADH-quinone oxidoreductase subunit J n=1 Tax=Halobaculum gomorrense TaxID=43928 RepID=A0A1M5MYV0_9EURY|nr:NADH dehydrogenase [Halobaculum gomorrense]SHG82302.1 NADH-quinone oxidoreductase subunit J [Halobaculum gomorrense]
MSDADSGSRPRLKLGGHLAPGLAAVALFGVLALVFLRASFGEAAGFEQGASITAAIGYAMFDIDAGAVPGESMLVAFEIIDLVLVAALAGAVMLARTGAGASVVTALTDGGRDSESATIADSVRELRDTLRGGEE